MEENDFGAPQAQAAFNRVFDDNPDLQVSLGILLADDNFRRSMDEIHSGRRAGAQTLSQFRRLINLILTNQPRLNFAIASKLLAGVPRQRGPRSTKAGVAASRLGVARRLGKEQQFRSCTALFRDLDLTDKQLSLKARSGEFSNNPGRLPKTIRLSKSDNVRVKQLRNAGLTQRQAKDRARGEKKLRFARHLGELGITRAVNPTPNEVAALSIPIISGEVARRRKASRVSGAGPRTVSASVERSRQVADILLQQAEQDMDEGRLRFSEDRTTIQGTPTLNISGRKVVRLTRKESREAPGLARVLSVSNAVARRLLVARKRRNQNLPLSTAQQRLLIRFP